MNNSEHTQANREPGELMADAAQGFDVSHTFVQPDADHLRLGAASMFAVGAGELIYRKLIAHGVTDGQIDELDREGLLEAKLQELVPDELARIKQYVQRLAIDPQARSALEDEVYFTDSEQGRTRND